MELIPDQARLVYTGVDYKIFELATELSDGTIQQTELIRWRDSGKVIAIKDDKILIAQEQKYWKWEYYALLWGRIHRDENIQEGTKREFLEETGMVIHDLKHIMDFNRMAPIRFQISVFVTHDFVKISEPILRSGEKIKIKEVSFDDFLTIVCSEHFRWDEFKEKIKEIKKDPNTTKDFHKLLFSR